MIKVGEHITIDFLGVKKDYTPEFYEKIIYNGILLNEIFLSSKSFSIQKYWHAKTRHGKNCILLSCIPIVMKEPVHFSDSLFVIKVVKKSKMGSKQAFKYFSLQSRWAI